MEAYNHCQSCGMPLDDVSILGTEKDGTKSHIYCKYCYRNGVFIRPDMTLDDMRAHLLQLMKPLRMTDTMVKEHLAGLPHLKRWQ